jgi:hypothetical protein
MGKNTADKPKRGLGWGGGLALTVMVLVLVAAVWFAYWGWNLTNAEISTTGMTALILGIVFSMLVGGGLMALVFYSSRKGYDR